MFATTATVDTLSLVVLQVTVGVEAIGVQLNLLVGSVSTRVVFLLYDYIRLHWSRVQCNTM